MALAIKTVTAQVERAEKNHSKKDELHCCYAVEKCRIQVERQQTLLVRGKVASVCALHVRLQVEKETEVVLVRATSGSYCIRRVRQVSRLHQLDRVSARHGINIRIILRMASILRRCASVDVLFSTFRKCLRDIFSIYCGA